jgi:hypothetical protein
MTSMAVRAPRQSRSRRVRSLAWFVLVLAAWTARVMAQQPPGSKTGNPTPGAPQPDPPALADRITIRGCLQSVTTGGTSRPAAPHDPGAPADDRFVLSKSERVPVVPPDTGTSPLAGSSSSRTYRLLAIDAQLFSFVGSQVEISGEVLALAAGDPVGAAPVVQVEFVQRVAPACP